MLSDLELVEQLREVLREADLTTTTTAIVRRKLEEHFGVDLSDRKGFIRENIDLYLQSLQGGGDEEEEEDGDGKEENEEGAVDGGEGNGGSDEVEEEEDEDEEEGSSNGKSSGGRKGSSKHNKEVKRKPSGFTKLCSLSPQLQNFVGESELARTEVVKRIWAYIREKNLQDPSNKRKILCDEKLNAIFNVKSIDMFQMNKALTKHIWPLDSENGPSKPKEKEPKERRLKKEVEEECDDEEDEPPQKEKRQKTGSGGFLAPLRLSDALVKFIGTGESELSRSDVVKRIWEYIKQNGLQDPSDKRRILCDEKLKELFEVDFFNGFTVAKLLSAHFVKEEK